MIQTNIHQTQTGNNLTFATCLEIVWAPNDISLRNGQLVYIAYVEQLRVISR